MKYFIFLAITLFFSIGFTYSQTNSIDTAFAAANLKSDAESMRKLFVEKDYTHYVKYINPKVVASAGGSDKMITLLKKSMSGMESQGITLKDLKIGDPSAIIITKSGLQSVVPQILNLHVKQGRLESTSYLIALSGDKGKTWTFIDTSGKSLKDMQKLFPSLSNGLVIPERQKPLLYDY